MRDISAQNRALRSMKLPVDLLRRLRASAGRGCTPQELETIVVEGHYEEVRLIAVKELQRRRNEEYTTMVSNYETKLTNLEQFRARLIAEHNTKLDSLATSLKSAEDERVELRKSHEKSMSELLSTREKLSSERDLLLKRCDEKDVETRELVDKTRGEYEELMRTTREEHNLLIESTKREHEEAMAKMAEERSDINIEREQTILEYDMKMDELRKLLETTEKASEKKIRELEEMVKSLESTKSSVDNLDERIRGLMDGLKTTNSRALSPPATGDSMPNMFAPSRDPGVSSDVTRVNVWMCFEPVDESCYSYCSFVPNLSCIIRGTIRQKGPKKAILSSLLQLLDTIDGTTISVGVLYVNSEYVEGVFRDDYCYDTNGKPRRVGEKKIHEDLIMRVMGHRYHRVSFVNVRDESNNRNYAIAREYMGRPHLLDAHKDWTLISN